MLPVHRYEVGRKDRREENIMGVVIYARRCGRSIERKYFGRDHARNVSSDNSREVVYQDEE